jgi:hypothetical protein
MSEETNLEPSFDPSEGPPEPGQGASASSEPEAEPVEAEAEAAETEEAQKSEADSLPADEQNVEKKSDPFQERIDKLTRRFRETERDLDQVARERDEALRKLNELDVPRPETKTLADFDHDENAYRDYLLTEATKRAESVAKKALEGYESSRESDRVLDEYHSRERTFASTVEDFDSVVYDEHLKISPVMAAEIRASELGPELFYHLGKNPDIASRISALAERAAVREMVLLETKLQTARDAKAKVVSDAPPPPPKKVKSGDPGVEKDPAKMSDNEFRKWREKQIAARR